MTNNHIVIIGFTSCGKTVTGDLLAKSLRCQFIDIDDLIEKEYHKRANESLTCREIYKTIGKEEFRDLETMVLKNIKLSESLVLSTGGGTPLTLENRDILKRIGTIVYLKGDSTVVFDRMQNKGIPAFLEHDPTINGLELLMNQRNNIYEDLADVCVDTSVMDPTCIVTTIRQLLKI